MDEQVPTFAALRMADGACIALRSLYAEPDDATYTGAADCDPRTYADTVA